MFDVVVIGGGAAGLSAALVLGPARRRTLVLDGGPPRNAPAASARGFLTRDGTPPAELLRLGRDELRPYTEVDLQRAAAIDARALAGGFEVSTSEGTTVRCRKLLLAYGVVDDVPEIEGLAELWGRSVLHCPYCHGWELRDQPLALYGRGQVGVDLARLLFGWSRDLVLCTDGPAELTDEQRTHLAGHGIGVREEPIARLAARDGALEHIVLADGTVLARRAMFLRPRQRPRSDLAARLGCDLTDKGLIRTDDSGETSIPGVYAAGDAAVCPVRGVIGAAASGATVAMGINRALLTADFDSPNAARSAPALQTTG